MLPGQTRYVGWMEEAEGSEDSRARERSALELAEAMAARNWVGTC